MVVAVSTEAKIVLVLEQAVLPVADSLGLPIAAPGVAYEPTGSPYLRVSIAKNQPINVSLSGGREPVRQGLLLVTACYPIGAGILPATETAAIVRDAFRFNSRFDFAGGFVKVTSEPRVVGDMVDGVYVEIPVSIPWMAFS